MVWKREVRRVLGVGMRTCEDSAEQVSSRSPLAVVTTEQFQRAVVHFLWIFYNYLLYFFFLNFPLK